MTRSYNNISDITQAFFRIETDLKLLDVEEDDVLLWESVRYPLFQRIIVEMGLQDPVWGLGRKGLPWVLKTLRFFLISLFYRNPLFAPKGALVIIGHPRRKFENGRFVDIYTEPLIDLIGAEQDCVLLEPSSAEFLHRSPVGSVEVRYLDVVERLVNVAQRLIPVRLSPKTQERYQSAEVAFNREFGITISLLPIIRRELARWKASRPVYRWLFRHLKPRAILLVVSTHKEPLIMAAKDAGISTVELQHGSPAEGKLAYHFPNGVYKRAFPDRFFSYGPYWNTPLPLPPEHVRNVGFPYLEKRRWLYEGVAKKPQMVVISQPTIGARLARFVMELRQVAPSHVEFVYKIHPGEAADWQQRYGFLAEAGIHVSTDPSQDLYQILAESTWQLGVFSTALYEGLAFGCHTFILRAPGFEPMIPLAGRGLITLVDKAEMVDFSPVKNPVEGQCLFAPVSAENYLSEISLLTRN